MNIALFLPHLDVAGGLGVHCRMVVNALSQVESNHTFTILAPRNPAALFPHVATESFDFNLTDRFVFRCIEIPAGFNLAEPLDALLAASLEDVKPDVLYCSYYTGMAKPPCQQIVAFHDAGFLENPAGFGATAVIRKQTIETIRPAISLIQCISFDARDRICRLLPWDEKKTTVIWHALPDSRTAIEAAKASPPLPDFRLPYLLVPVGAATGFNRVRKNVPTAVKAFREMKAGSANLVIAGTATLTERVLAELLPANETGAIHGDRWVSDDGTIMILPTVSRADFLVLMRHAIAVVYPSRYEGFGLPTVEAMAMGTPLIAARATSIPEIVGDAGILVDPDDVPGFSNAMSSLTNDSALSTDFVERGKKRLASFSIERFGKHFLEMVKSA
jgi:glycosyltransferase involved in cell wall biosynthesis